MKIEDYKNRLSLKNKIGRLIWQLIALLLFKPFTLKFFNPWRIFVLRCCGAKLHPKAIVYANVKIWAPWNLEMDAFACLGPNVDCYNPAIIKIGTKSTVSQKAYLCSASHDISSLETPLIVGSINIGEYAWIGTGVFIMMGVTIGEGAVVGARAAVFKDVEPWTVVGGNPAKFIKKREIKE